MYGEIGVDPGAGGADILLELMVDLSVVAALYPPLAWFVIDSAVAVPLQRWRWDPRRKFLVSNVVIYPFVFVLLMVISDSMFGIGEELKPLVDGVLEGHRQAIEDGIPSERNNAALGLLFVTAPFVGALLVFTVGAGVLYFLGSTLAYGRGVFGSIWRAQAFGLGVSLIGIAAAYIFRTPIFNWFS